jgi:anti-sigma regulatory factor (Ser/Thr protein kinase)
VKERFGLEVEAREDNIPQITQFISQVMKRSAFSDREGMETMLAVEEACTNIALYAYGPGSGRIRLEAEVSEDAVDIFIEDEGIPFNPIAERAAAQAGKRVGGWGLTLMKGLVDSVSYQRRRGKNLLRLTKTAGRKDATFAP